MRKRLYTYLITAAAATMMLVGNAKTAYAVTQDELTEWLEQRAKEEGINLDDYRGPGQKDPAAGYEYGGEYNPNSNPAPLPGESAGGNTTASQPAASTQKPAAPAHEHSYKADLTTNPTCTEEGIMTYTCECGDSYTEPYPMLDHQYEAEVTKEATCIEEGEATYTCKLCGDSYTESLPLVNHIEGVSAVETRPTCTEDGETVTSCSVCGEELRRDVIPAKGHTEGEQAVFKAATYFSEGTAEIRCTDCEEVLNTITLAKLPIPFTAYIVCAVIVIGVIAGVIILVRREKE